MKYQDAIDALKEVIRKKKSRLAKLRAMADAFYDADSAITNPYDASIEIVKDEIYRLNYAILVLEIDAQ